MVALEMLTGITAASVTKPQPQHSVTERLLTAVAPEALPLVRAPRQKIVDFYHITKLITLYYHY